MLTSADARPNTHDAQYERRVLGTHLSKAKCDDFIYQNIGPTGEYVYLHGHVEEEKA